MEKYGIIFFSEIGIGIVFIMSLVLSVIYDDWFFYLFKKIIDFFKLNGGEKSYYWYLKKSGEEGKMFIVFDLCKWGWIRGFVLFVVFGGFEVFVVLLWGLKGFFCYLVFLDLGGLVWLVCLSLEDFFLLFLFWELLMEFVYFLF